MTFDQLFSVALIAIGLAAIAVVTHLGLRRIERADEDAQRREYADAVYTPRPGIARTHRPDERGVCRGCLGRVPFADCPQAGFAADAARLLADWERALGGGRRG